MILRSPHARTFRGSVKTSRTIWSVALTRKPSTHLIRLTYSRDSSLKQSVKRCRTMKPTGRCLRVPLRHGPRFWARPGETAEPHPGEPAPRDRPHRPSNITYATASKTLLDQPAPSAACMAFRSPVDPAGGISPGAPTPRPAPSRRPGQLWFLTIAALLSNPVSRGSAHTRRSDTADAPLIDLAADLGGDLDRAKRYA